MKSAIFAALATNRIPKSMFWGSFSRCSRQFIYTKSINELNKSINECWASENLGLYNLLTRTYASSTKQEQSLSSYPQFSQLTIIIKNFLCTAGNHPLIFLFGRNSLHSFHTKYIQKDTSGFLFKLKSM